MTTLLSLLQQAISEVGTSDTPISIVGNPDRQIKQWLALLNGLGRELRKSDWQALQKEYRFTTQYQTLTGTTILGSAVVTGITSTAGLTTDYMVTGVGINTDTMIVSVDSPTQVTLSQSASASGTVSLNFCQVAYALPSDYVKLINRTQWDKSKHWEMQGPETPQQWQWIKSGYISSGPRVRFRVMGSKFHIWPAMATNEFLGFEYTSNGWVESLTGVAKSLFSADTDTCIFPDNVMISGVKMRFFEVKGLDASAFRAEYMEALTAAKGADAAAPTLSMAPRPSTVLIGVQNLPDSGYGR